MRTRERRGIRKAGLLSLVIAVLSLAPVVLLEAQDLAAERGRVLAVLGQTKAADLPLFPLRQGMGFAFEQPVLEPGARSLRVHFLVERPGESWGVQIKDANGAVVWSTWDAAVQGTDFWSDEIPGGSLTLEVHSSRPSNLLKLRVDKILVGADTDTQVSHVGPNQLRSIVGQDGWIVGLGESVVRLRFVGDDGRGYVCSGFLVTPELLLTNQHCIATTSELRSALVDFDFDREGAIGRTLRLSQLLDTDHDLDYSVVRLEEPVGRVPLNLEPNRPGAGRRLVVIQHPSGRPKEVSIADCSVSGALVTGRGGGQTDFGHACDTERGSSGAPVLDFEARDVVGLHHLGITPGSNALFNRAVHIGLILENMDPVVRAEIEAGQP
jgi:hypothetical protein